MKLVAPEVKRDPVLRWALADAEFFGQGACHILAGVFLDLRRADGWYAEHIVPDDERPGAHVFATNGELAFDFQGFQTRRALLERHFAFWRGRDETWACRVTRVSYSLLDQRALNARKMLGPEQYLHDPIPRAERFISKQELSAPAQ